MLNTAIRWSGLVLLAGALLMGAGFVQRTILLPASILIILALPGMYARQSEATGWLGLLGHILFEVGMVPLVVYAAAPLFSSEIKEQTIPNTGAILLGTAWLFGLALTGIATLRAAVYPRWSGILLLTAGIGFLFVFSSVKDLPASTYQLGTAIFGMFFVSALAWIGLSIWTSPRRHDMASSPEGTRLAG